MEQTLRPDVKKEITPTPHQEEALRNMLVWSKSNEPFHTLKGSAGVGKTTVLQLFCKRYHKAYKMAVSAPTHKAKKVVEKSTGKTGETIQGLLGLRPNTDIEDFDINNPQFDQIAESKIADYRGGLIVIDEASMFNADLHKAICNEAKQYNVKILFVGDELQLPPVNESISKALTEHPISNLTEVIRQKNTNPLGPVLSALRTDILEGKDTFDDIIRNAPVNINDNGEGYEVLNADEFAAKVAEFYSSEEFEANPDYCKLVAWTNQCVGEWNKFIRSARITSTEELVEGDIILAYNSVRSEKNDILLTNSEDYKIREVSERITNTLSKVPSVRVAVCKIGENYPTWLNVVLPRDERAFLEVWAELHATAIRKKGRAWIDYFKFKNQHLLLRDITEGKRLLVKKDFDYGYAMTVHKTQGSTYENVFVNLPNIKRNFTPEDRRKLTYVAASRASKRCFILAP